MAMWPKSDKLPSVSYHNERKYFFFKFDILNSKNLVDGRRGDGSACECWLLDINVKQSQEGLTALHLACRYNSTDVTQYLLSRQADVNVADAKGRTPLHCATRRGNDLVTKVCLFLYLYSTLFCFNLAETINIVLYLLSINVSLTVLPHACLHVIVTLMISGKQ